MVSTSLSGQISSVWGKSAVFPYRYKREEGAGSSAEEFVNSSGEKGQTKTLLWAAVRARFSACSGLLWNVFFNSILFLSMQLLRRSSWRMWCILKCFASQMGFIFIQGQFCWLTGKRLVLKLDLYKSFAFHLLHYTSAWITGLPRWHLSITFKHLTWAKWLIWHFM